MNIQREKKKSTKSDRLETRVPPELKAILQRAAALQGQTLTDFVLAATMEAARQVIQKHEMLELSQRDQVVFAETLLDPPGATSRMKKAANRYRQGVRK